MRNRWLVAALAVSLALNLAGLSAFACIRFRQYRQRQEFFRHLRSGARAKLAALFEEMEPKMDSLRAVYWDARQNLGMMGFDENPDPVHIESLLSVIAETHKEMNRQIFEGTRAVSAFYPPEAQDKLKRRMFDVWRGPPGHHPHGRRFLRRPGRRPHPGLPPPCEGCPPEAPDDIGP